MGAPEIFLQCEPFVTCKVSSYRDPLGVRIGQRPRVQVGTGGDNVWVDTWRLVAGRV